MISKAANLVGGNEWIIGTNPSGLYQFLIYGVAAGVNIGLLSTANASGDVDRWVHLVTTYTGSSTHAGMSIYRNGVKLATSNTSSGVYAAMSNTTTPVDIGRIFGSASPQYAKGYIQDVRIYNRALSGTEVMQLYKETMNRK
jgi:hypothetical protein